MRIFLKVYISIVVLPLILLFGPVMLFWKLTGLRNRKTWERKVVNTYCRAAMALVGHYSAARRIRWTECEAHPIDVMWMVAGRDLPASISLGTDWED